MSIFGWFKGDKKEHSPAPKVQEQPNEPNRQTEQEQFKSPVLLASWVDCHILEGMPLDDNYALLPDEESRKALNITYEQRERYIREIPVLRVAGVSLFIKQHYDDTFWLTFSQSLYPLMVKYLNSSSYSTTVHEIAEAVEGYVDAAGEKDDKKMSLQYLHRVYDDSDHFFKLMLGGVSSLAVDWLADSYEIFRNAHCQVTQGMSYDSFKVITDAMKRAEKNLESTSKTD